MGMIKRIIGRTSRKILSKINPNVNSQELILDQPAQPGDLNLALHKSTKQQFARLHRRAKKSGGDYSTVAEAMLLAVKHYLPPVQFHHVHGPNTQLSSSKSIARRTQSFCQALVFSSRIIFPNERIYIKVLDIAKGWSGTIRFGFTAVDPATLARRMPKHACPDMTNAGHTWARALADEVVRRNSVIHFSYNKEGFIHYGINNQDCGIFHANVNTKQNLWFIVDIYGLTAAVELIDPTVYNSGSELALLAERDETTRCTTYKSTSLMDDIFGGGRQSASGGRHSKRKQLRKAARHQAAGIIHGNWPLERALIDTQHGGLRLPHYNEQQQGTQLPNLNSVTLPSAQQNIYSPMPANPQLMSTSQTRTRELANETIHDYHQIISNNIHSTNSVYQSVRDYYQPKPNASAAAAAVNLTTASSVNSSASFSASLNSSGTSSHSGGGGDSLCGHFEGINITTDNDTISNLDQRGQSLSRSSKSTNAHSQTPVAAARGRQQQSASVQTNSKRSPETRVQTKALNQRVGSSSSKPQTLSASSLALSPLSVANTSSAQTATTTSKHQSSSGKENIKPKARHSIKQKSSTTTTSSNRDSNNNTPPSKDCPICFERPINCVLYQCGHMCTCYECGVKQWKTQSRTCPICRTIIKDVIKTYMS